LVSLSSVNNINKNQASFPALAVRDHALPAFLETKMPRLNVAMAYSSRRTLIHDATGRSSILVEIGAGWA
jgi:hypothetical protein